MSIDCGQYCVNDSTATIVYVENVVQKQLCSVLLLAPAPPHVIFYTCMYVSLTIAHCQTFRSNYI